MTYQSPSCDVFYPCIDRGFCQSSVGGSTEKVGNLYELWGSENVSETEN